MKSFHARAHLERHRTEHIGWLRAAVLGANFCPGPGLVALGVGEVKALFFLAAMLAGMGVFEWLERPKRLS